MGLVLNEFIDELKRSLGNRTDITTGRYIRWLNWALLDIAGFHRQRVFPGVKFHELEGFLHFTVGPLVCHAESAIERGVYVDELVNDSFLNSTLVVSGYTGQAPDGLIGQQRKVVATAGTNVVLVDLPWDVDPDANTELTFYFSWPRFGIDISADQFQNVYSIMKLTNDQGQVLEQVDWRDIAINVYSIGTPIKFARFNQSIVFDSAPETVMGFNLYSYNYPRQFIEVDLDARSPLPDMWDEVILLGAIYRGFSRLMEPDRAAETRTQYYDAITNKETPKSVDMFHNENRIKVRRR